MRKFKPATLLGVCALALGLLVAGGSQAQAASTWSETTGGDAHTWTNYTNAGGSEGQLIPGFATVQIACKLQGFQVADGNNWWYRIASSPWNYGYYVSADAFYNNGATSGSLHGTPFVDPAVADCDSGSGTAETAGGLANTWTDYTNAGGTAGPQIGGGSTVQIACKLGGFRVADGNTWWYRVASSPWNNGFYVSADAFYNNGATSGTLVGTPFVDPAVPDCAGSGGGSTPTAVLTQGPAAPAGFRYGISLAGFTPSTPISITCYDSVSPGGFYTFSLTANAAGSASTSSYCYSGDGPDHWIVANGRVASNHQAWGTAGSGPGGEIGLGSGTGGSSNGQPGGGIAIARSPGSTSSIILAAAITTVDGVKIGTATNGWHFYGPNRTCLVRDYNSPNNGHIMLVHYDNNTYHVVRNGMLWGWWDNGGASGSLGCPVTGEVSSTVVAGRVVIYQQFDRGWLYWTTGMNHAVVTSQASLQAIGWAWGELGKSEYAGYCLGFTIQAYQQGAGVHLTGGPYNNSDGAGSIARAYQWWTTRPVAEQHAGDANPPPGALVIWNPSAARDGSGHIALSIGHGWAISTETSGGNDPIYLLHIADWLPGYYYGWVTAR